MRISNPSQPKSPFQGPFVFRYQSELFLKKVVVHVQPLSDQATPTRPDIHVSSAVLFHAKDADKQADMRINSQCKFMVFNKYRIFSGSMAEVIIFCIPFIRNGIGLRKKGHVK